MATHTLLVADDSQTVRRIVEMACAGHDVDVVAVADGDGAIAEISQHPPDIVLADIEMPGRNGYEVAAFVKGRADLSHIPVLLMAGMYEPADEARASALGCAEVLIKPLRPQVVVDRMRHWLDVPDAVADHASSPEAMPMDAAPTDAAAQDDHPGGDAAPVQAAVDIEADAVATDAASTGSLHADISAIPPVTIPSSTPPVVPSIAVAADAATGQDFGGEETDALFVADVVGQTGLDAFEPARDEVVEHEPMHSRPAGPAEDYFTRLDAAFKSLARPTGGADTHVRAVASSVEVPGTAEPVPTLQELLDRLPQETRTRLSEETQPAAAPDDSARRPGGVDAREAGLVDAIASRVIEQLVDHEDLLDAIARRLALRQASNQPR